MTVSAAKKPDSDAMTTGELLPAINIAIIKPRDAGLLARGR